MSTKGPKLIAHRGNSSQAPENTPAAFKEAIRIPVDFLECDVQISKDGVPVVVHDGTFCRITNQSNPTPINELTVEEIKKIDAGSWFDPEYKDQRILTLEEFLFMPRGRIGIMLEVKEETFAACFMGKNVGDVLKKIEPQLKKYGPVLVGSLCPNVLLCLHAYLPEQPLIPIVKNLEDLEIFKTLQPSHYAFKHELLTKELLDELHDEGAKVWAWTVDDKDTAYQLVHMGVDGLITNHPKKMVSFCHPDREKISRVGFSRLYRR